MSIPAWDARAASPLQLPAPVERTPAGIADAERDANRLIEAFRQSVAKGDVAEAMSSLKAATQLSGFSSISTEVQYAVYSGLGWLEISQRQFEQAYDHLMVAAEVAPELRDALYWQALLLATLVLERDGAIIEAAANMAREYPDAFLSLDNEFRRQVFRSLATTPRSAPAKLELLQALFEMHYRPSDGYGSAEWLWLELFWIYVDRGKTEEATRVSTELSSPGSIVSLAVDLRSAGFAPADPSSAYTAALHKQRTLAEARPGEKPRELRAVVWLADRLTADGEFEAALQLLDDNLAKIDSAPEGQPAFDDLGDYLGWAENSRARILLKLGRLNEALEAQVRSRSASSDGVSQVINLGEMYYALNRPTEALEALRTVGSDASAYGKMAAASVRVCSLTMLGRKDDASKSVAYMMEHVDDGFAPAVEALLCADDSDALAKLLIARLEDPEKRNEALVTIQPYARRLTDIATGEPLDKRLDDIRERPDVAAAIAKYGRVVVWPGFEPAS